MKNKENMTDEDVLRAAIEVAQGNRYELPKWVYNPKSIEHLGSAILRCNYLERIIFDPLFAKAFWGTEKIPIINQYNDRDDKISWKYHIQQLALAKNRLKYLKRFL